MHKKFSLILILTLWMYIPIIHRVIHLASMGDQVRRLLMYSTKYWLLLKVIPNYKFNRAKCLHKEPLEKAAMEIIDKMCYISTVDQSGNLKEQLIFIAGRKEHFINCRKGGHYINNAFPLHIVATAAVQSTLLSRASGIKHT